MRGIYSSVTDIRRKVFTEVARMAYEGGDYHRIEKLPYKILPVMWVNIVTVFFLSAPLSASACVWRVGCLCVRLISMLL